MKEVSKARLLCGIFALLLLFYDIFVSIPDIMKLIGQYSVIDYKMILNFVFRLGFFLSISLWSLSGILKFKETE